jgi:hypothetical protein
LLNYRKKLTSSNSEVVIVDHESVGAFVDGHTPVIVINKLSGLN